MAVTRLTVRVQPRSRFTEVTLTADGSVRVRVTAAPESGKANAAVREALAEALGIAKSDVSIAAGPASRKKLIDVAMSMEEVRKRLTEG